MMAEGQFEVSLTSLSTAAARITSIASRVDEAGSAAGITVGANQIDTGLSHGGRELNVDFAFGLLCQPFGQLVHSMADPTARAVQAAAERIHTTAKRVSDSAKTYHEAELKALRALRGIDATEGHLVNIPAPAGGS